MPTRWFVGGIAALGRGLLQRVPRVTLALAVALDLVLLLIGLAVIIWGIWEFSPAVARIAAGVCIVLLATLPLSRRRA